MSKNISVFLDVRKLSTDEIIDLIKNHELFSSCCNFIEEKKLNGLAIMELTQSQVLSWRTPKWLLRNLLSLKNSLLTNPEIFLNPEDEEDSVDYYNNSTVNNHSASLHNISSKLESVLKPQKLQNSSPNAEFYDEMNYLKPSAIHSRNYKPKQISMPDAKSPNNVTPIQFRSPVALPRDDFEENVYESAPHEVEPIKPKYSSSNTKSSSPTPKLPQRKPMIVQKKAVDSTAVTTTEIPRRKFSHLNSSSVSNKRTELLSKQKPFSKAPISTPEEEMYDDPDNKSADKSTGIKNQQLKSSSQIGQDQKLKNFLNLNKHTRKTSPVRSKQDPALNHDNSQKDSTNSVLKPKVLPFFQGFRRKSEDKSTMEKRPYYENANEVNEKFSQKNYIGLKINEGTSKKLTSLMSRPLPPVPAESSLSISIDEEHQPEYSNASDSLSDYTDHHSNVNNTSCSRLTPVLSRPLPPLPKAVEKSRAQEEVLSSKEEFEDNLPDYINAETFIPQQSNAQILPEPETSHHQETNFQSIRSLILKKEIKLEDSFAEALRKKLDERKLRKNDKNTVNKTEGSSTLPKPPVSFFKNALKVETRNPLQTQHDNISEPESDGEYDDFSSDYNLNNEEFYRNTDRKGAKLLLQHLEDGAFVLRPSQHKDQYFLSITVKSNRKYFNAGIMRTPSGNFYCGQGMSKTPEFTTLKSFIDFFEKNPLVFPGENGAEKVYLRKILPSDTF